MSDEKKLTLAPRAPLSMKKTVDAGNVKQSFSHGRSKTVIVEKKKAWTIRRPGEEEAEAVEAAVDMVVETPPAPPPVAIEPEPVSEPVPELVVEAPVALEPEPVALAPEPVPPAVVSTAPQETPQAVVIEVPVAVASPKPAARPAPPPTSLRSPPRSSNNTNNSNGRSGRNNRDGRGNNNASAVSAVDERMARHELVQQAMRQAEEERLRAAEDQRRRGDEEREAAILAEREARESKRQAEEEAQQQALERERLAAIAAERKTIAPQPTSRTPRTSQPTLSAPVAPGGAEGAVAATPEEGARDWGRGQPPRRKLEVAAKPATTRPRVDDRRQSGKLTVTRALDSGDETRMRSLAALRRAREKEKRGQGVAAAPVRQARDVVIPEAITVQELANRMAERAADVVKALFKMGMVVTINQSLDQDIAELIVSEFGHVVKRVSEADVEEGVVGAVDVHGDLQPRPPVVTIMGHVDHGKTSLLDALRNANVVGGEAGGITQHIGAYQVTAPNGDKITFLDTPGHAAFTEMRARGAMVTDIVILVVAADDGIMPQTIEAINHTKAAGVPMIVAINKIDKYEADPEKVRQHLLQYDVVVEKMSGDVQDVEVSAKQKLNLDKLLEAIALQAEVLELKANPHRSAEGTVVEARLEKGRGPVATVLINRGTLSIGDVFVVGAEWGKVRALIDDRGRQIKTAGPSQPVEVLGLSGVPSAGDPFSVVESEPKAREVAAYRQTLAQRKRQATGPSSLESMFIALKAKDIAELPLVIKADMHGSMEAITHAVNSLSTPEVRARVLHAGVGGITESDVTLAQASNAAILGFNVRANAKARLAAEQAGVALQYYDIIYDLVDAVKSAMAGKLGPEVIETIMGVAQVRDVFQAGKTGKAAGCLVLEGVMRRNLRARLMRDDVVIHTGAISSLRRFKDDVAEVRSGMECGMGLEGFHDIKAGDKIEVFQVESRERTL